MIRDFKMLEAPFLVDASGYSTSRKGGYSLDSPSEPSDYYNCRYKTLSLWQRMRWVYERSSVIELSESLALVQARRTARQTTDIAIAVNYLTRKVGEVEGMVAGMEDRLSRVVGIRRVDDGGSRRGERGGYE